MRIRGETSEGVGESNSTAQSKLIRSSHEFEAQMMKELLQPMCRRDVDGEEAGSGGALADFAAEALGSGISRAGGFGIADRILAEISRNQTQFAVESALGKNDSIQAYKLK